MTLIPASKSGRALALSVAATVAGASAFVGSPALAQQEAGKKYKEPAMSIDPAKQYVATIQTSQGTIVADLFAKDAPRTVNSFAFLAKEKYFDGLIFHRVIPGFMIQGGDPTGTGTGGPGYQFPNENKASTHGFPPGTLAMANAGADTNGSQFFITDANVGHLDAAKYTIFGQVTSGLDVVKKIARAQRDAGDRPIMPMQIESITVEEKAAADATTKPAG